MKRYIIALTAALCCSVAAIAQTPANAEGDMRLLRLEAYRTIQQYERYLSWADDAEYLGQLMQLFLDRNVPVYNDMLLLSDEPTLTIQQYLDILPLHNAVNAEVSAIQLREPRRGERGWEIDVEFNKHMRYTLDNSIYVDTRRQLGGHDFVLVAHLVWLPAERCCKISGIDGSLAAEAQPLRIGTQYLVLQRMRNNDDHLRINGSAPAFIDGEYALYGVAEPSLLSINYPNPDMRVRLVADETRQHFWYATYRPRFIKIKPRFELSLGNYYAVTAAQGYSLDENKSSGMEFGLDLGYVLPLESSFRLAIMTGVGMATSKLNIGYDLQNFSYDTDVDIDGDPYLRRYTNVRLSSGYTFSDLVVPLYLSGELPVMSRLKVIVDLGAKLYSSMSNGVSSMEGSYRVDGLYAKYDNLVLGQSSGINGFTENGQIDAGHVAYAQPIERKGTTIDIFGRAGVSVGIYGPLSVDVAVGYQMSMGDVYVNTATQQGNIPPLVYDGQRELVNDPVAVASLKRQMLNLSMGLTLKF